MIYSSYASASFSLLGKTANPADVQPDTITTTKTYDGRVQVYWDPIADIDFQEYIVRVNTTGDWDTAAEVYKGADNRFSYKVSPEDVIGTYYLLIKAKDTTNNYSEITAEHTFEVSYPSTVLESSVTCTPVSAGYLKVSWDSVSDVDFKEYEVRVGESAVWDNATEVYTGADPRCSFIPSDIPYSYILVKSKNATGHYSEVAASKIFELVGLTTPVLTYALNGENVAITWTDCAGQFAINKYEVFTDSALTNLLEVGGHPIEVGTSLNTSFKVEWKIKDTPTLYVRATDSIGRVSSSVGTDITILPPNTTELIDNKTFEQSLIANSGFDGTNYKMSWVTPTVEGNRLPIVGYIVSYFQASTFFPIIDQCDITEKSVLVNWGPTKGETTRTYSVQPKDSAGNLGEPGVLPVTVSPPGQITPNSELVGDVLEISWGENTGSLPIVEYETREDDSDWGSGGYKKLSSTLGYKEKVTWDVDTFSTGKPFFIRAKDSAGNYSVTATAQLEISRPSNLISLSTNSGFDGGVFRLQWEEASSVVGINTLPISKYIIYRGNPAENGSQYTYNTPEITKTVLDEARVLSKDVPVTWGPSNPNKFWVVPVDTAGNSSDTSTETDAWSVLSQVVSPGAPELSYTFVGSNVLIQWLAPTTVEGSLPVVGYETREGDSDWGSDSPAPLKAGDPTRYIEKVDWADSKTYYVKAVDSAGNWGETATISANVVAPSDVGSLSKVIIDNNVILKWPLGVGGPGQLPIEHYEVYKCPTFECGVESIGSTTPTIELGTSSVFFETTSGYYRYWVKAKDVAGNLSAGAYIDAYVNQPPDYELLADLSVNYDTETLEGAYCGGTEGADETACIANGGIWRQATSHSSSNILLSEEGEAWAPINMTETWESHFSSRNIDNIAAGHTYFVSGSLGDQAVYWQQWDIGMAIPGAQLNFGTSLHSFQGAVGVSPQLYWTDSDAAFSNTDISDVTGWNTQGAGPFNVPVLESLRYIKIRITYIAVQEDSIIALANQTVKAEAKTVTDSGSGVVTTADSGVLVQYKREFNDVTAITVTPRNGTAAVTALYDFVDTINPTGFTVYLYDSNGNKTTGSFSWSAQGIDGRALGA